MTDWMLALVPQYGLWILVLTAFLSCSGFPMPSPLFLLAGGGLAASGDMVLWQVMVAGLTGAMLGDQAGFGLARWKGEPWLDRLAHKPRRAAMVQRARTQIQKRGAGAIFLSRWLFSPLGPWVNVATGAAGFSWVRFTQIGLLGEALWVLIYANAGYAFAGNAEAALAQIHRFTLPLAAGALIWVGWLWLRAKARKSARQTPDAQG